MADVVFEMCSCGAEFRWAGSAIYASSKVNEWRKTHIHDMAAAVARAQAKQPATVKYETHVGAPEEYPRMGRKGDF